MATSEVQIPQIRANLVLAKSGGYFGHKVSVSQLPAVSPVQIWDENIHRRNPAFSFFFLTIGDL